MLSQKKSTLAKLNGHTKPLKLDDYTAININEQPSSTNPPLPEILISIDAAEAESSYNSLPEEKEPERPTPPQHIVNIDQPKAETAEEIKNAIDMKLSTPSYTNRRNALSMLILMLTGGMDSIQFYLGLSDIKGKLLGCIEGSPRLYIALATCYFIQAYTLNKKFTGDGIDNIYRIYLGSKPEEWEELEKTDEKKANLLSFTVNTYTFFSDTFVAAFYLEQQGSQVRALNFMIAMLKALASTPTEGYQSHSHFRSRFSKAKKTITATTENIMKSSYYTGLNPAQRKTFDKLWVELSLFLRMALSHPANKGFLNSDGKELTAQLDIIFSLSTLDAKKNALLKLQLDSEQAIDFAKKLSTLAEEKEVDVSCSENVFNKVVELLEYLLKSVVKTFSSIQDMGESYISVAAMFLRMFSLASPGLRMALLVLSSANGIRDWIFNGKNSSDAIDQFKAALKKAWTESKLDIKQTLAFLVSLFTALVLSHASYSLSLFMFTLPDAQLPPPLWGILPDLLARFLAVTSSTREAITNTAFLMPFFEGVVNIPVNLFHALPCFKKSEEQPKTQQPAENKKEEKVPDHSFTNENDFVLDIEDALLDNIASQVDLSETAKVERTLANIKLEPQSRMFPTPIRGTNVSSIATSPYLLWQKKSTMESEKKVPMATKQYSFT